jgi:hypothetical protein
MLSPGEHFDASCAPLNHQSHTVKRRTPLSSHRASQPRGTQVNAVLRYHSRQRGEIIEDNTQVLSGR